MMGRSVPGSPDIDENTPLSQIETIRELINTNNDAEMFFSDIDKLIEKSMKKFNELAGEGNNEIKLFEKLLSKLFKKSTEQLQKVVNPVIDGTDKLQEITRLVAESDGSKKTTDLNKVGRDS